MKCILFALFMFAGLISCNGPEQNTAVGNSQDSVTLKTDTVDTRGTKGTGVDNSGGTPGPGTITDTFKGKVDTPDNTSRKKGGK